MAYHGYVPAIKHFISCLPYEYTPTILEVGVDKGMTFIPLFVFLARARQKFFLAGVDIKLQDNVLVTLSHIDKTSEQELQLIQNNSLVVLPQFIDANIKFDVFLLDGDHNYHTVSQELEYLEKLTHSHSLVIVDDYHGRWSRRDLWYSEKSEHTSDCATQRVETEKHGVADAVDEWLSKNPEWELLCPIQGEPVVLKRR